MANSHEAGEWQFKCASVSKDSTLLDTSCRTRAESCFLPVSPNAV